MTANKARRESIAAVRGYTAPATVFQTSETLVADDLWPLPTYQEMLFIL
jgi:glutamine synthetase type III